jgi:hypothetical protein
VWDAPRAVLGPAVTQAAGDVSDAGRSPVNPRVGGSIHLVQDRRRSVRLTLRSKY